MLHEFELGAPVRLDIDVRPSQLVKRPIRSLIGEL